MNFISNFDLGRYGEIFLSSTAFGEKCRMEPIPGIKIPSGNELLHSLKAPTQIQWTYLRICNLRCKHCFNNSSPAWKNKEEIDPFFVIDRIIEALPFNVCLCGGEPLAWNLLFDIIEKLKSGGIPLISTVTNGYLMTKEKAKRLKEVGMTTVQVSVDGITREEHAAIRGYPESFDKAINAIKMCAEVGIPQISCAMLPTRLNINSVSKYVEMMISLGVNQIRFQPFMPLGRACNFPELIPTAEEYFHLRNRIRILKAMYPKKDIQWGDPLEHILWHTNGKGFPWSLGIQTDGSYEISPYIPVSFGHVNTHSIHQIWNEGLGIQGLWEHPVVKKIAEGLHTIDGMAHIKPDIYTGENIRIDPYTGEVVYPENMES